jgi:hypothetical protein
MGENGARSLDRAFYPGQRLGNNRNLPPGIPDLPPFLSHFITDFQFPDPVGFVASPSDAIGSYKTFRVDPSWLPPDPFLYTISTIAILYKGVNQGGPRPSGSWAAGISADFQDGAGRVWTEGAMTDLASPFPPTATKSTRYAIPYGGTAGVFDIKLDGDIQYRLRCGVPPTTSFTASITISGSIYYL